MSAADAASMGDGEAGLADIELEALRALCRQDLLPEGVDMDRLQRLGLVERVGITWGITEAGRASVDASR